MLIYPFIIKFINKYYLCIKIINEDSNEKLYFKLVKDKKIVQELVNPIFQKEHVYFFKLKKSVVELEENIRLFYEKGGKNYYVESINMYDCMIVDENQISYKFINEIKRNLLNELRGIRDYE